MHTAEFKPKYVAGTLHIDTSTYLFQAFEFGKIVQTKSFQNCRYRVLLFLSVNQRFLAVNYIINSNLKKNSKQRTILRIWLP